MSDSTPSNGMSLTRRLVEIVIGLVVFAVFVNTYTNVLVAFHRESDRNALVIVDYDKMQAPSINGHLTVTGVDPVKGELSARLELEPDESLLEEDAYSLKQDLTVSVNNMKGKQMETYKKGTRLSPIDVTLALFDGDASEYPFDLHKAELCLDVSYMHREKGESADEAEEVFIPVGMVFEASAPGYSFKVAESTTTKSKKTAGFESAALEVERSSTVKGFSVFIITLIWAISVTILIMTLAVWLRGRKFEFGMMTFYAAMLFAFPAIRNLQPMVPPIGAWPDFACVFWAQGIVGSCIVIVLFVWLARSAKG